MNSKNHDLTEFEELITELQDPEVRPYAPNLPRETKEEMRRTLFTPQEDGLSRYAVMNLWKFAGTAVAAILLIFIVASFIAVLSNPSTQTGPQENVVSPPTRADGSATPEMMNSQAETQYIGTMEPVRSVSNNIIFDDLVQLTDYELLSVEDGTLLRLHWLPLDILDARFHVFVHFIDENGNLSLQVDELPAAEMPLFSREENEVIESDILLPTNDLPNGSYDVIFGLYNTRTGERLNVTVHDPALAVDNNTAVRIGHWPLDNNLPDGPVADNTDIQFGDALRLNALESFHLNNRITASLYLVPLQEDLPDYVMALTVKDRNGVLVERLYQPLRDDSSMWTVNEPFYGEYEFVLPNALPNGVYQSWLALYNTDTGQFLPTELLLETWVQEGGWDPASVAPLTVSANRISDLILYQQPDGEPYDISLDENVSLILTFVDSDELINDGNTAWIPLQFTSQETNETLRGWVPLDIYNRIKAFALDIQDPTAEPLVESGSVWLVSVTQKERPSVDSPIELEITVGYEFVSDEEVFIKLSYADLGWASPGTSGRVPIDGLGTEDLYLFDKNRGEVTINATLHPNEAMQIVGNENPVVVAQLGYIDEYRRVLNLLANVTFSQYPLDLTTTEEIHYSP